MFWKWFDKNKFLLHHLPPIGEIKDISDFVFG